MPRGRPACGNPVRALTSHILVDDAFRVVEIGSFPLQKANRAMAKNPLIHSNHRGPASDGRSVVPGPPPEKYSKGDR